MSLFGRESAHGSSRGRSEESDRATEAERATAAEIVMDPRGADSAKLHPDTQPGLALGNLVSDFTASSTQGIFQWHERIDDFWALLVSLPADFAPVCTTELASLAKLTPEFEKRGIKIFVVSANTLEEHLDWIRDVELSEFTSGSPVTFPVISDSDRTIAEAYGMLDPNEKDRNGLPVTCRAVALIGPDKRLKLSMLYPVSTGRNMTEILRIIDSIQTSAEHGVLTPANWAPGEKCLVDPGMVDEEATRQFGKVTTVSMSSGKNYLRLVDDPSGLGRSEFSWKSVIRTFLGIGTGVMLGVLGGKLIKPLRERN